MAVAVAGAPAPGRCQRLCCSLLSHRTVLAATGSLSATSVIAPRSAAHGSKPGACTGHNAQGASLPLFSVNDSRGPDRQDPIRLQGRRRTCTTSPGSRRLHPSSALVLLLQSRWPGWLVVEGYSPTPARHSRVCLRIRGEGKKIDRLSASAMCKI